MKELPYGEASSTQPSADNRESNDETPDETTPQVKKQNCGMCELRNNTCESDKLYEVSKFQKQKAEFITEKMKVSGKGPGLLDLNSKICPKCNAVVNKKMKDQHYTPLKTRKKGSSKCYTCDFCPYRGIDSKNYIAQSELLKVSDFDSSKQHFATKFLESEFHKPTERKGLLNNQSLVCEVCEKIIQRSFDAWKRGCMMNSPQHQGKSPAKRQFKRSLQFSTKEECFICGTIIDENDVDEKKRSAEKLSQEIRMKYVDVGFELNKRFSNKVHQICHLQNESRLGNITSPAEKTADISYDDEVEQEATAIPFHRDQTTSDFDFSNELIDLEQYDLGDSLDNASDNASNNSAGSNAKLDEDEIKNICRNEAMEYFKRMIDIRKHILKSNIYNYYVNLVHKMCIKHDVHIETSSLYHQFLDRALPAIASKLNLKAHNLKVIPQ